MLPVFQPGSELFETQFADAVTKAVTPLIKI